MIITEEGLDILFRDGWYWGRSTSSLHASFFYLMPPPGDSRHDWAAEWIELEFLPNHFVPHWIDQIATPLTCSLNYRVHHRCSNCEHVLHEGEHALYCDIANDRPLMMHQDDNGYRKLIKAWRATHKVDFHGECDRWKQEQK